MAKNVTSADIFNGMFARLPAQGEVGQINEKAAGQPAAIALNRLNPFKNHPFRVTEDEQMEELVESIRQYGIQEPVLVRPNQEQGGYEIISGHRRCHAAGMAGLTEVPVQIKELPDSLATVLMVDSNNKREALLPSEKAWAYRMKAEALKRQGKRNDLAGGADGPSGMDAVAGNRGGSVRTVQRYIRLTYLVEGLLQLCDAGKLSVGLGYALSYFSIEEQNLILSFYQTSGKLPDAKQIEKLRDWKKQEALTMETVGAVFGAKKQGTVSRTVTVKEKCLGRYFPADATKEYMESVILELLEEWARKQGLPDRGAVETGF